MLLEFIPPGTDLKPILPVLAKVFDTALEGGGAKNFNFQVRPGLPPGRCSPPWPAAPSLSCYQQVAASCFRTGGSHLSSCQLTCQVETLDVYTTF